MVSVEFDGHFKVNRINGRINQSLLKADRLRLVPGSHEVEVTLREFPDDHTGTIRISVADHQILQLKGRIEGANPFIEVWDLNPSSGKPVKIATHPLHWHKSPAANMPPPSNPRQWRRSATALAFGGESR